MKPLLFLLVVLQLTRIRGQFIEDDDDTDYKKEYEDLDKLFKDEHEKLNLAELKLLAATNKTPTTENPLMTSPVYNDTSENPSCGDYYASFGGAVALLRASENIISPRKTRGFSNNYPDNADCTRTRTFYLDSQAVGIYLEFDNFSTESCCDHVTVYEGWNTSGRVLLNASGSSIPNWIHLDSGSRMLVNFMSDGSVNSTGLWANFGGFYPGCDDIITGNNGTVNSTNYPNHYYNHMECRQQIWVSPGNRIRIDFLEFNTEGWCDYLEIYDRPFLNSTRLLRVSGTALPSSVTSTSNAILIRFTTDMSVGARGWRLTYTAV